MSTSNVPDPADWIELVSQFSIFFPNTGKRKHHVSSRTWKRISMLESRWTWLVHSYVLLQKRQGRIYYDCYVLGFEMQSFFSLKVSSLYGTLVGDNRMMKEETKKRMLGGWYWTQRSVWVYIGMHIVEIILIPLFFNKGAILILCLLYIYPQIRDFLRVVSTCGTS